MLRALANRKLQLGQAVRILDTQDHAWAFFIDALSRMIKLNVNETASFLEMTFDLANRLGTKNLAHVFDHQILRPIWEDNTITRKERGDALLKAMRRLRYPLYQKKSEELAAAWQELHLDELQGNKNLFFNRGLLEITIRARSRKEMSEKVSGLFESLNEPAWKRIWDE
jgi:predicted nucleic acid-binding protein